VTDTAKRCFLLLSFLAGICLISSIAWSASTAAAGGSNLVYSAKRSLTGNCSTSADDPIPDPGCPGGLHPPRPFDNPCGTDTDAYGNVYVASENPASTEGRIDIFNPKGEYLTEITDEHKPCDIAVDSEGKVFVAEHDSGKAAVVFPPSSYPPTKGTTFPTRVVVHRLPATGTCGEALSVAVDPSDDHLFVLYDCPAESVTEYGSASENLPGEDWTPLREGLGDELNSYVTGGIDVYGKNHYIYAAGVLRGAIESLESAQRAFVIDGSTNQQVCESDGTDTPAGGFSFIGGRAGIAVDQATGSFYVDDTNTHKVIDELSPDCEFEAQLPQPPTLSHPDYRAGLAADNPCLGPGEAPCDLGGYVSPNPGYVYVGSGHASGSHLFAYKPQSGGPPVVEGQAVVGVTDTEVTLTAKLNPSDVDTTYHFEYISQAAYEADGNEFGAGTVSVPLPAAALDEGDSFVEVSEPLNSLSPGTSYRFRLVAENEEGQTIGEGKPGEEGDDTRFATYEAQSLHLPDGRGYELVTPPDTGGYVPTMSELGAPHFGGLGPSFASNLTALNGDQVLFGLAGGALPGYPANGLHDTYEAHRQADGRWITEFNGVSGTDFAEAYPGGFSADHGASFWALTKSPKFPEGYYIRRSAGILSPACSPDPAAQLELIGCGSLGDEPEGVGEWISPDASHVIFTTRRENQRVPKQLEPDAAPSGTDAIYDRTADGITHVSSLKPDGSAFGANENATYRGVSSDGTAVAFTVNGTFYVRRDNLETLTVATGSPLFGGLSSDGAAVVYLKQNEGQPFRGTKVPQGDIFLCDLDEGPCAGPGSHSPTAIGSGEESVLVNVSSDGSHVYFVSPRVLDPAEEGRLGKENLYVWDDTGVRFIATVSSGDVAGRAGVYPVGGLGLWIGIAVSPDPTFLAGPGNDPSRTTPDGAILVFESRAELTDYDNDGHSEIYRYDAVHGGLDCLSCNRTGVSAQSDAQLQPDPPPQFVSSPPISAMVSIPNVTENGQRVFFESGDRLSLGDVDERTDVYEWEAAGEGDCSRQGGCVTLISSGTSSSDDHLYAMTPSGSNVFFASGDLLVAEDSDATPSIYDARIGGGAPEPPTPPQDCVGEACQPAGSPPRDPILASSSFHGPKNVAQRPRCQRPKQRSRGHAKHRAQAAKRKRCVRRRRHGHPHQRPARLDREADR
jgi:hypothetical protein